MNSHRVEFIVGALALPAPHVPPVVDEAADVEIRSVNEPAEDEYKYPDLCVIHDSPNP